MSAPIVNGHELEAQPDGSFRGTRVVIDRRIDGTWFGLMFVGKSSVLVNGVGPYVVAVMLNVEHRKLTDEIAEVGSPGHL